MELVTSWRTLFQLAGQCGQKKMKLLADPTPENEADYVAAVQKHDAYRDLCLEADRMVDFPVLS